MAPISDPYGSRSSKDAAIIARQEPVVYTDYESFDNDEVRTRVKAFESDGYLLIEDLFSDEEVEALRAEIKELASSDEIQSRDETFWSQVQEAFVRFFGFMS